MKTIEVTIEKTDETERIGIARDDRFDEAVKIVRSAAKEWAEDEELQLEYYATDYIQEQLDEAGITNEVITLPDEYIVIEED